MTNKAALAIQILQSLIIWLLLVPFGILLSTDSLQIKIYKIHKKDMNIKKMLSCMWLSQGHTGWREPYVRVVHAESQDLRHFRARAVASVDHRTNSDGDSSEKKDSHEEVVTGSIFPSVEELLQILFPLFLENRKERLESLANSASYFAQSILITTVLYNSTPYFVMLWWLFLGIFEAHIFVRHTLTAIALLFSHYRCLRGEERQDVSMDLNIECFNLVNVLLLFVLAASCTLGLSKIAWVSHLFIDIVSIYVVNKENDKYHAPTPKKFFILRFFISKSVTLLLMFFPVSPLQQWKALHYVSKAPYFHYVTNFVITYVVNPFIIYIDNGLIYITRYIQIFKFTVLLQAIFLIIQTKFIFCDIQKYYETIFLTVKDIVYIVFWPREIARCVA